MRKHTPAPGKGRDRLSADLDTPLCLCAAAVGILQLHPWAQGEQRIGILQLVLYNA